MKFQPIYTDLERPDVIRSKHRYGLWFGLILGLGFSIFTWGIDGYILSAHNGLQPWLKFILGAAICATIGGVAGWLAAKANRPMAAVAIWLVAGSIFAWLTVNLPLVILPRALSVLEPQAGGLLHYTYYEDFNRRVWVGFTWLGIFISLAGLLQIPMSDSAVFSTSLFGKAAPFFVSLALMGIAGIIVDTGLINEPLRGSVVAIDNTIQFILDNRGREVDSTAARRMHAGAFHAIEDSVTQKRGLIVSGYDGQLGEVNVLVKFERVWVECQVFYNQPISCKEIEFAP